MSSKLAIFDGSNPRLGGVFGKMNRAVDHVKELDKWFEGWIKTDPWSVDTETDSDGIAKRLYLRYSNPIPTWVGLVVGDAIHNLRSALDHLAVAEAGMHGRGPEGVWFPIAPCADVYPNIRNDKLRKCSEAFRDFIDNLKPYRGGNDALYALHQLDLIDKHRLLVPVGAASSVSIIADTGFYGAIDFSRVTEPVKIRIPDKSTFVNDGDTVFDFAPTAFWFPQEAEIKTETALSVAFGEGTPVVGQDISDAIKDMVRAVKEVIVNAEPLFFR